MSTFRPEKVWGGQIRLIGSGGCCYSCGEGRPEETPRCGDAAAADRGVGPDALRSGRLARAALCAGTAPGGAGAGPAVPLRPGRLPPIARGVPHQTEFAALVFLLRQLNQSANPMNSPRK